MASPISETEPATEASVVSSGPDDTRALGERLGRLLREGDCIALGGTLGAGKTVMAQGIVAGAGAGTDVRSPTFVLEMIHRGGRVAVHHLDLYRLPDGADLRLLGLDEALTKGAAVVEWPERTEAAWFTAWAVLSIRSDTARQIDLRLPAHLLSAVGQR